MAHCATQAVLELGILLQPLSLSASVTELSHHSRLKQCNNLLVPEVLSAWEAEAGESLHSRTGNCKSLSHQWRCWQMHSSCSQLGSILPAHAVL